ncbi:S1/P1 nuclease [uncultured Paraglaciecola sp.]|uniref:S1/P1 nuclease n=1 Tax=uncultured Paraglaciecola sp. TaxID=1765024 RepID=UPI0030DC6947|tara:strand:+ start:68251 stop:69027 length:777 start_codon:yes stop_codon:yes gene_type:complete
MKFRTLIIGTVAAAMSFQALSWGQVGHRVTGAIAEQYLTPKTQLAISQLLFNEDLAEASTYADEMRSDPSEFWKKTASPWHYVNVFDGKAYADVAPPPEGNAVTALEMFTKQLKSKKSSLAEKQLAIRFIVHIIGDLHQPFHAGNGIDRGGNDVKLTFFWEDSNLHRVWDSGLIDRQQLSYTEWTQILSRKISEQQAKEWGELDPKVWIAESAKVRATLYPETDKLSWDYQYQNLPIVKQRLQMAGVRIAAYLNAIFE